MKCDACGQDNVDNARRCVRCGSPLNPRGTSGSTQQSGPAMKKIALIAVILMIIAAVGFYLINSGQQGEPLNGGGDVTMESEAPASTE